MSTFVLGAVREAAMDPDWDDYSDSVIDAEKRRYESWYRLRASCFESPFERWRRRALAALGRFWRWGTRQL